jgi:hypothetical protein
MDSTRRRTQDCACPRSLLPEREAVIFGAAAERSFPPSRGTIDGLPGLNL